MKRISLLSIPVVLPAAMAASPQLSSQDRGWLIGAHRSNLAEISGARSG